MRRNRRRLILMWLGVSILVVLTLSSALQGQASPNSEAAVPVTTDWSHHHLIFSRPATAEQTERVQQDPRYWQQLSRQSSARLPEAETSGSLASGLRRSSASLPGMNRGLNPDWSQDMGTGASVGAGNFPAKFSFNSTNANCGGAPQPDFVVYSTGLFGSATQANIVAYENLYSGCTGTVPTVYWAYNTGSTVVTSPVFSRDGKQVAFVQENGAAHGIVVFLKWAASTTETIGTPAAPMPVLPVLYPACIAPCMTTFGLRDSGGTLNNDSNSSVFYDYSNDAAYVGDDAGLLHKFTPVFNGVPAEVRTGGWPVQVSATPTALNSPVHDFASGNVFVTDNGGFLYLVNSSTAAVTASGQLDFSSAFDGGPGIVQGPIVDSTAGKVYVFAPSDGSGGCPIGIGGADCTAVFQLTTSFALGDLGSEAVVGSSTSGTVPSPLYVGAFDSTYENSVNATGNLYVCGNTGGDPILYQVAITSGAFGTVSAGPVLSTTFGVTPCSPVTDVLNPNAAGGATEWMFASAATGGTSSGCAAGGCLFNFKDTPWKKATAYTVGQEVLDSHFQIQVVSVAGTSGATPPSWQVIAGRTTTDGTVHWLDQGLQSAVTLAAWKPSHAYALHSKILDGNNNVEFVTTAGTSGTTVPTFTTTAGGITSDGTGALKWTNLGALGTAALPASGGTSGIIIDNTVGSGTQAGASQIYFSTLSDQTCGTSGTGGCAVQASQSALQ
jgi:hypothetical protein